MTAALERISDGRFDGVMCTCPHGNRGRAHGTSYLLIEPDAKPLPACVGAAAAFAAKHRLRFPLTSSTPPEAP